ncbi:hypothetical protein [Bacillus thuringiensis]|uniref:hypothetical protein n=1 Tax=Bacillus thuringiensis TaxID=1428 RepID=UPI0015C51C96|nr:hypothetical protein [Bacillus thuringiensis]
MKMMVLASILLIIGYLIGMPKAYLSKNKWKVISFLGIAVSIMWTIFGLAYVMSIIGK